MAKTGQRKEKISESNLDPKASDESDLLEVLPQLVVSSQVNDDKSILSENASLLHPCIDGGYWLLMFIAASMINAWISALYVYNNISFYIFVRSGRVLSTKMNWKCALFSSTCMLTSIRIVFQIASAINFLRGLGSSNKEQMYKNTMRYIDIGFFVALEQLFSVVCIIVGIILESFSEEEKPWIAAFLTTNLIDLYFFVCASKFFDCYAETMRLELEGSTTI